MESISKHNSVMQGAYGSGGGKQIPRLAYLFGCRSGGRGDLGHNSGVA